MTTKQNKDILSVNYLGKLTIRFRGKNLKLSRSVSDKMTQLFLMLIYTENGVGKDDLIRILYEHVDSAQASNLLRALIFRLRKNLIAAGLPDEPYIINEDGVYRWKAEKVMLFLDTTEFQQVIQTAQEENQPWKKKLLYETADRLYQGEFLPDMIGDEWAAVENRRLQEIYFTAMRELFAILKKEKNYGELLPYCEKVAEQYPYEEWQIELLDCLIARKDYKQALNYYEEIARQYQENFGMKLSWELQKRLEQIREQIHYDINSISEIQEQLMKENPGRGKNYRDFLAFAEIYRYMTRVLERNGQSAYLMLYTITDRNHMPVNQEEVLADVRDCLMEAIDHTIRNSDLHTQYGKNQFLVLLQGTDEAGCELVAQRVHRRFQANNRRKKVEICYSVSSILDVKLFGYETEHDPAQP